MLFKKKKARIEIITHGLPTLINASCGNKNRVLLKYAWLMEFHMARLFLTLAFSSCKTEIINLNAYNIDMLCLLPSLKNNWIIIVKAP